MQSVQLCYICFLSNHLGPSIKLLAVTLGLACKLEVIEYDVVLDLVYF